MKWKICYRRFNWFMWGTENRLRNSSPHGGSKEWAIELGNLRTGAKAVDAPLDVATTNHEKSEETIVY